jgi:hypothetical protein
LLLRTRGPWCMSQREGIDRLYDQTLSQVQNIQHDAGE